MTPSHNGKYNRRISVQTNPLERTNFSSKQPFGSSIIRQFVSGGIQMLLVDKKLLKREVVRTLITVIKSNNNGYDEA
jgi:hypothetical protein